MVDRVAIVVLYSSVVMLSSVLLRWVSFGLSILCMSLMMVVVVLFFDISLVRVLIVVWFVIYG